MSYYRLEYIGNAEKGTPPTSLCFSYAGRGKQLLMDE
jgi:hypothetical protein